MTEIVYLYFMDKESKEIISAEEGELYIPSTKKPKTTYVTTCSREVGGSGNIYKVSINAGEVKDFKGSTVRLWLPKNDKLEAYKCFKSYFGNKFREDMEKMRRLIEEAEESKNGN